MMQCPKCQVENRDEARFCQECGNKLELPCPQCGNMHPLISKFCDKCGQDLAVAPKPVLKPLSFDEKLEKIQSYLPGDLTGKILAQRGKIEGERRQVTVMFCDLKGFTPLSEKLGEERLYSLVDGLFEMMIHRVHEFEGTVNKGTGDGIMALFGAPIALEDAPQRAIRSALAIQREMTRISNALKGEADVPPLQMRIGIHTGPVVVGSLGNDLRVEFTAVGDTVNLASRMEGLAEPGTVYVTEETFKLTEGFFRFEALGEKEIKGKERPVRAYRVIAPSTRRTRFDVSAELGLTPFVGRQKELELLLDGFERARSGKGQAFSIMGEAGVGKSRLLYEFRKAVGSEDVTFLEGKCLSYIRGVAYQPVIDILKSNFDVHENDSDDRIRDRVKEGLKQLSIDEPSTLPYLLELLGVNDSGMDKISLSPEGKKDRLLEAVKRVALRGSELRPLVLAVEDLHWTDRSSEDALKYLLESIPGSRILLIFTYRPEFVHTWGSRSYHSQVTLNRLSNRESMAMLTYLLGTEEVDTQIEDLVLEKTEGVPFFIEEFIRSLRDLNLIKRKNGSYHLTRDIHDISIPGTIQDMIMARVDSLPEASRGVLQAGSCIEREFSHELIRRITVIPEQQLLSHLSLLKDAELLYERGIYPSSTYIFRHALTREVVYNSILAHRRKKLHLEIAKAIEETNKDNLDDYYEALAEHYASAEDWEKGAQYCRLVERKYIRAGYFHESIAYAERRKNCLEKLPRNAEVEKQIIDARTSIGLSYTLMNYWLEAKEEVEPIIELALKHNYTRRIAQIYIVLGQYYSGVEEDFATGNKYLSDALKIGEEINDLLTISSSDFWIAFNNAMNCKFEKALYHFDRSLKIHEAAKSLWGMSTQKSCLAFLVYGFQGKIDLAYQASKAALSVADESGDYNSKTITYACHGYNCFFKGCFDESEQYLFQAIDHSERINYFTWNSIANFCLGELYFSKEEYQKCQAYFIKAISMRERGKTNPSFTNYMRSSLAEAKARNHEKDVDMDTLYVYAANNIYKFVDGQISRGIADVLLNINNQHSPDAEEWINKALVSDSSNGMMWQLGRDYACYAELLTRKGDLAGAREKLGKAIDTFRECGADGWVIKYEQEMAELQKSG